MRTVFSIVAVLLLAPLACSRGAGRPSTDAQPATFEGKPLGKTPPEAQASPAPSPQPTASQARVDAGAARIEPLKDGKRVVIAGLVGPPRLEMTVTPDMRLTIQKNLSDELLPTAILRGKDGVIEVASPDYDLGGLDRHLDDEFLVHSQRLDRGFLLIRRLKAHVRGMEHEYEVTVWRPDLEVICRSALSAIAETRASADTLASICLSLQEAPPKH